MSFLMHRYRMAAVILATLCLFCSQKSSADTIVASTNAEIRVTGASGTDMTGDPSGIREFMGATSTLFFNVEGSANVPFEVFAVADFAIPANASATSIAAGATLTIFEDPAGFALAGPVEVYLAADSSAGLIDVTANPGPGIPSYQTGMDSAACLDPAFAVFPTMLGSAVFTPTAAGNPTVIPLTFTGAELAHALSIATSGGGTMRLLVAPGAATTALTGAGQENTDGPPPTLDITYVGGAVATPPTSFTVILGSVNSGGVPELVDSDNQYLVLDPEFLTFRYQLQYTVDATSPSSSPSALEFTYESRATNFVGTVDQEIELFNYDSGQFETVDTRLAAGTDTVVSVTPGGDPGRFVQAGTDAMQARISYQNSLPFWVFSTKNLYLPYRVRADQVLWSITP